MGEPKSSETLKAKRSDAEDAAVWDRFAGRPGEDAKVSAVHRMRIAGTTPDGFGLHMRLKAMFARVIVAAFKQSCATAHPVPHPICSAPGAPGEAIETAKILNPIIDQKAGPVGASIALGK